MEFGAAPTGPPSMRVCGNSFSPFVTKCFACRPDQSQKVSLGKALSRFLGCKAMSASVHPPPFGKRPVNPGRNKGSLLTFVPEFGPSLSTDFSW